jgi:hypothetical protein
LFPFSFDSRNIYKFPSPNFNDPLIIKTCSVRVTYTPMFSGSIHNSHILESA